ncbi:helix-turn-helix transcriptional regulator [Lentzea sp. BCCO 10_0798]|uniref:Helix-turn-helix transcriptional regulator n=1 Tax=Lentzea kristufekii TaxID=3095430 RepID=A0ABU4U7P4_9PSEU|nr:helix-turn-helix transcriptional regulator [Lentzea sp. BCCO 10_0798]MDX8056067.1 helix-turn-helix transcriptional regulator [Lentzea sp. BCCO 10_0798]
MPKDFRATTLERSIGRQLAWWRDERGLSLAEAGHRVGFSSAKLSTMENAVQPSMPLDIMALGYVYNVPTPEWQALVLRAEYAKTARVSGGSAEPLFDPIADFASLVFEVTELRAFTTDLVPTGLQLRSYAHAAGSPERIAQLSKVREAWATRLSDKDPPMVEAVFPEAVLRPLVGGPRVMKAQLLHLMEISEHSTVTVQVIPVVAGAYPAMGCPFTLLGFPHRQHNDVAYLETAIKGEYVEDQALVEQLAQRFAELQRIALSPDESLELIAEAAADL